MKEKLNKSDFKKIIFSNNNRVRKKFKKNFKKEIKIFIEKIFEAYQSYDLINQRIEGDKRKSYIAAYLFKAINDLVNSFNILISGQLIPAGNLMRQFFESSAIAILLSSEKLDFLERIEKEGNKFPAHKSLNYVSKHKKKLNINENGWNAFRKFEKNYDLYSHSSPFSLVDTSLYLKKRDKKGSLLLKFGADFDPDRINHYRIEIERRISAVKSLKNIIDGLLQNKTS